MFLLFAFWNSLIICAGEITTFPPFKIVKETPAVLQFNTSNVFSGISCTLITDEQVIKVYTYESESINEAEGPLKHRAVLIVTPYGFELRISQTKISDSGEYRCISGSNIWVAILIVEGKPEILKQSSHSEHEPSKHQEPSLPKLNEHGLSEHNKHGLPEINVHGSPEHNEHEFEEEIHLHVNYCSNPLPTINRWYLPKHDHFITADTKLESIIARKKEISRYCFEEEILVFHIKKVNSGEYTFKLGNSYGNESISFHVVVLPEPKEFDPVLVTCLVIFGTTLIAAGLLIIYWVMLHKKSPSNVDHMAKVARKGAYSSVESEQKYH